VRKSREKIKTLAERVESVRGHVDGWEKAEGEWQERTRKRLKVLWMVIASVGVVIFGALAFQYAPARTHGPPVLKGLNASEFGGALPDVDLEKIRNETWTLKRSTEDALEKMKAKNREKEEEEEDPRLRIFDEL